MSAPKLRVLIVGAGIAGTCLAYWLARTGLDISITIVERSPVPRTAGQSIDIRGSAIKIIKDMGLEEAIRDRYTTEEGTSFINSAGKTFAQFDAGDTFTADYEILRADLAEVFTQATESLDSVHYRYGDSVKSLEQTEKNVHITFTSGSSDTFDLVVAADGAASKTRPMILDSQILKDSYNFLGQYLAFFSIPAQPTDPKMWHWYNTTNGLCIMTRPHRNPSTMGAYLCVTMPARGVRNPAYEEALDKGNQDAKHALRASFENAGWQAPRVLDGMDAASDFYITRAAQVKLPKWHHHRALVLGDAAFATFGVGTSLAIESSYVLAGELAKINGGEDVPAALERYEAVFRPVAEKMEDLMPFFPQMAFPQTAWALWIRDALLWFVAKTKVHKWFANGAEEEVGLPGYEWVAAR